MKDMKFMKVKRKGDVDFLIIILHALHVLHGKFLTKTLLKPCYSKSSLNSFRQSSFDPLIK